MQQDALANSQIALLINVAILTYVLYRQVIARPVRSDRSTIGALLIVGGAINFAIFLGSSHVGAGDLALVLLGLTVLAIGFGAVRAYTVRLWRNKEGAAYRQGTWLTVLLWLVSIALHAFIDISSHTHSASLYLYFGITLSVQRLIVGRRAAKIAP